MIKLSVTQHFNENVEALLWALGIIMIMSTIFIICENNNVLQFDCPLLYITLIHHSIGLIVVCINGTEDVDNTPTKTKDE